MERGWTLWRGELLLGTIVAGNSDFPWLRGAWTPEPAFADVSGRFERELQLLDEERMDEFLAEWNSIYGLGIHMRAPDGRVAAEYLLHIDGNEAWFRWSDEPLE